MPTLIFGAPTAREMYTAALAREQALRASWEQARSNTDKPLPVSPASRKEVRSLIGAYEALVRRHPISGYCDNALWQAAMLAADVFADSHQDADRQTASRLFTSLAREYPTSPFARKAADQARRLDGSTPANASSAARNAEATNRGRGASTDATPAPRVGDAPASASAVIRDIRRTVLPEVVRVSIELDREVAFHEERVENPPRLLFDLPATRTVPSLQDANWTYADDIVRGIRVGRHPNQASRVVVDLDGVSRYTVVTLYNPYRILIDCERVAPATPTKPQPARPLSSPPASIGTSDAKPPAARPQPADGKDDSAGPSAKSEDAPVERAPTATAKKLETAKPTRSGIERSRAPAALDAPLSMARQLGLGVSRIVIDPGHGGRDPGAEGTGSSEAQIVLDIALRLEKLLLKQPGVDVVLTRRSDVFVPLEERTELANREQADLFLSIHANASRNEQARGIETYYLNFASNPDAEAVAARENSASERTMNSLTDIVKAIALNTKLDESKDFAGLVQRAMARRLKTSNKSLKDLGVKQAPFVVLIGAGMPSVLAEVSFLTNRREGQLLGSESYRQRIAEALADGVLRYRRELKSAEVLAHQ